MLWYDFIAFYYELLKFLQLIEKNHHSCMYHLWRFLLNNLKYADNITLMAESEELTSLLVKVKEERGKVGLKLNIQKTKIMVSSPITSWQIDEETVETVADFILGGLQNHCRWWLLPWN